MLDVKASTSGNVQGNSAARNVPYPKPNLELPPMESNTNYTTIFSIIALVLVVIAAILLYVMKSTKVSALKSQEAELQKLTAELGTSPLKELDKQILDIQNGLKIFETAMSGKLYYSKLFTEINSRDPKNIKFSVFALDENGNVKVTGDAPDNISVAKLIRSFEDSKMFSEVMLVSSNQTDLDGVIINKFTVSFKVNSSELKNNASVPSGQTVPQTSGQNPNAGTNDAVKPVTNP